MHQSNYKRRMKGHLLGQSYLNYLVFHDKSSIVVTSVNADEEDTKRYLINWSLTVEKNHQYLS